MLTSLRLFLGTKVDNSPLVVFRIFFGLLIVGESFGAIMTGWVHETFIEPQFTFTIIGFEWLQPLPEDGMIYYFLVMGFLGILISLGLFYRAATFSFFGLWTVVYIMQKSHYNNHYYLLILLAAAMFLLPAHHYFSLDAKWGLTKKTQVCARACHWFFIVQIMIVYVFASMHKMNPDWIAGRPLDVWFKHKSHYWLIGPLLSQEWMPYLIAWGGILFDGLIVFILLGKRTRKVGFILTIAFNLFNSAVFQIGVFPYLMILLTVFFYPPDEIRKLFFRKKTPNNPSKEKFPIFWTCLFLMYFTVQLLLPMRNHLFQGKPSWTEEGHRLAWRMMLRRKSGRAEIEVVNKKTNEREKVKLSDYLTRKQSSAFKAKPDMIWQFAQYLKKEYAETGVDIAVYAKVRLSLNGGPVQNLINPEVDLASVPWEPWRHSDWILTYDD